MHVIVLILWIASWLAFAYAAFTPRPFVAANAIALGLLGFDLWLGLHFLIEGGERITF